MLDRDAGGIFIWLSRDTTSHAKSDLQSVCRDGSVRSYGVDVIWMLLAQRGITKARSRMYVLRALAFDDRTEQHVSIYLGEDQIVHVF